MTLEWQEVHVAPHVGGNYRVRPKGDKFEAVTPLGIKIGAFDSVDAAKEACEAAIDAPPTPPDLPPAGQPRMPPQPRREPPKPEPKQPPKPAATTAPRPAAKPPSHRR